MEWLRTQVRRAPRRALVIGKIIFLIGAILIVGAVFARASLTGINSGRAEAKQPPLLTLGQAYPQYPTWLVPEGPVGFSISAVLVLVGMGLTVLAGEAGKPGRR